MAVNSKLRNQKYIVNENVVHNYDTWKQLVLKNTQAMEQLHVYQLTFF